MDGDQAGQAARVWRWPARFFFTYHDQGSHMAGKPWIKWTVGLARKSEIMVMAEDLGISRHEAAGRCMELWEWAEDQTDNGNVHGVTYSTVNKLQGLENFAQVLEKIGWISRTKKGIKLVGFAAHNGQLSKARALTALRVKKFRNANAVTKGATENKRKENTNIKPPKNISDLIRASSLDEDAGNKGGLLQ